MRSDFTKSNRTPDFLVVAFSTPNPASTLAEKAWLLLGRLKFDVEPELGALRRVRTWRESAGEVGGELGNLLTRNLGAPADHPIDAVGPTFFRAAGARNRIERVTGFAVLQHESLFGAFGKNVG